MINRLLLLLGCFVFNAGFAQLSVQRLLIENQSNPLGIDIKSTIQLAVISVYIRAIDEKAVNEGTDLLRESKNVVINGKQDGYIVVEIGSVTYHFTIGKK